VNLAYEIEELIKDGAGYELAQHIGSDVLDAIDGFLARFIAYPNDHYRHIHTLWIAHCWLIGCWEYTPRLLFISPEPGSGKTRALTITGQLVPRPDHVADFTPAALYYSIDEAQERRGGRPTALYDELDTVFGGADTGRLRNEPMRRMINAGHDRSERVSRKIGKETKRFALYAPMALAGKMSADDVPSTIASRSIIIPMQKRRPGDVVERWTRRDGALAAEPVRWALACWAELVNEYAAYDYRGPDLPHDMDDREADVWWPIFAVAELAGGHWPKRAAVTAVTVVTAVTAEMAPSEGVRLLWETRMIFNATKKDNLTSKFMLEELHKTGEFIWTKLPAQRAGIKMANILRTYGVGPGVFRSGTKTYKGYAREEFEDAWLRYLRPSGNSGDSGDTGNKKADDHE
jgi:hypothetical protein